MNRRNRVFIRHIRRKSSIDSLKVKTFHTRQDISRILPQKRYATKQSKMKLCNSVAYDGNANSCTINDNTMMKKFTCLDDKNPPTNAFRSLQCCRVLSFRSTESVSLCIICKEMMKLSKNKIHMNESKRVPCQDITNTCYSTSKVISDVHDVRNSVILSRENLNVTSTEVVIENLSKKSDLSPEIENKEKSKCISKDINQNEPTGSISLSSADNSDLTQIFDEVINISPPKIVEFLVSQQKALSHKPKGRRWSKSIIRICLTLWCRSQKCDKELRDSGFLLLPSQRTLQIYKNKINQKPGINNELIHWMKNEALSRNLPPGGYEGGLILDEMSIQSDLEFCSRDGNVYLWGFKEVTDESEFIESILNGKKEIKLATHVLQFVFLGFTGFRFPLFHFPTEQASALELYLLFWKIVNILSTFGFKIQYVSLDGAPTNWDFAKLLLGTFKSDLIKTMTVKNIFSFKQEPICVIMDYSHLIKNIRNNLHKSGRLDSYKRHLKFNGHFIYWEYFANAYM